MPSAQRFLGPMATVWPRPAEMDHGTTLSGRTPRLKFPPWRSLASHQTTTKWYRRGWGTNSTPSRISVPLPSLSSARTSVVVANRSSSAFASSQPLATYTTPGTTTRLLRFHWRRALRTLVKSRVPSRSTGPPRSGQDTKPFGVDIAAA
jgi:hypothetical protein